MKTDSKVIQTDSDVEGRWIYMKEDAGGYGMNPFNAGKIFIGKRVVVYKGKGPCVETYKYSNLNSAESNGNYHNPNKVVQTTLMENCRFATKKEIKDLGQSHLTITPHMEPEQNNRLLWNK